MIARCLKYLTYSTAAGNGAEWDLLMKAKYLAFVFERRSW
jgi:hypothetical protein